MVTSARTPLRGSPGYNSNLGILRGPERRTGDEMPTEISISQWQVVNWWWPPYPFPLHGTTLRNIDCLPEAHSRTEPSCFQWETTYRQAFLPVPPLSKLVSWDPSHQINHLFSVLGVLFCFCLFVAFDRVSLCCLGWPWTSSLKQSSPLSLQVAGTTGMHYHTLPLSLVLVLRHHSIF